METVTAQDVAIPSMGLGTWQMTGDTCRQAVEAALEVGYRHVDTAQAYGNEADVGRAIDASSVDRDDVFLVTKLDWNNRTFERVHRSVRKSLERLRTTYLDLLLIHQPNYLTRASLEETLAAMDELVAEGVVEHIGVSNFGVDRLHRARESADAPIVTDQVQYHPYWDQQDLLDYCRIHDVALTAYSPLAQGGVLRDGKLQRIGHRYGKSAAQVALRWLVQQEGVVTIPQSTNPEHIRENCEVFDFELTAPEMREIHRPSKLRTGYYYLRSQLGV